MDSNSSHRSGDRCHRNVVSIKEVMKPMLIQYLNHIPNAPAIGILNVVGAFSPICEVWGAEYYYPEQYGSFNYFTTAF